MKRHDINQLIKNTIDEHYHDGKLPDNMPRVDKDLREPPHLISDAGRGQLADHLNDTFAATAKMHPKRAKPIKPALVSTDTTPLVTVGKLRKLIAPRVKFLLLGFTSFILGASQLSDVHAAVNGEDTTIYIEDYDFDGNINFVTFNERRVYAIHKTHPFLKKYDSNKNGKLDPAEVLEFNSDIEDEAQDALSDIATVPSTGPFTEISKEPIPLSTFFEQTLDKPKREPSSPSPDEVAKDYSNNHSWYVRQRGEDVSLRSGSAKNDAQKNNGANFNFVYDDESASKSGSIQAAVGFLNRRRLKTGRLANPKEPYLGELAYGASVELDKIWDPNPTAEKDSLILRLGGDLQLTNYVFPISYLSSYGYYETDTSFDKKIVGAEFIFEPYTTDFRNFAIIGGNYLLVRLVPEIISKYGHVVDQGPAPLAYNDFWDVGLGAAIYFDYMNSTRRIASFSSRYQPRWNATQDFEFSYDWENKLSIWLDDASTVSADVSYQLANDRVLGDKTNRFELGLGLKY